MQRKDLSYLRDCVKEALDKGSARGLEFRKMRHAIIAELKRLGYESSEIKDSLLEWNKRCEKPLSLSERKIQLLGYADWFFKKNCKTGCRALEDYCVGKDKCQFYLRATYQNRQKTQKLPFDIQELEKFLTGRFKAEGYVMMLVVRALEHFQHEKATGETILVGFRTMSSVIRDRLGHNILPMTVFRAMRFLEEEGVLKKVVVGKPGSFTHQANGYRFLPWKPRSNNPY